VQVTEAEQATADTPEAQVDGSSWPNSWPKIVQPSNVEAALFRAENSARAAWIGPAARLGAAEAVEWRATAPTGAARPCRMRPPKRWLRRECDSSGRSRGPMVVGEAGDCGQRRDVGPPARGPDAVRSG
jgi:hypothetical protein